MRQISFIWQVIVLSLLLAGCGTKNYTQYVNPFIGTASNGHTFPGAVQPFGMVSVSPHTVCNGYSEQNSPAGYKYGAKYIYGFGHVHLSGVGCNDLGSVILTPYSGKLSFSPDMYRSAYDNEVAKPGYYAVTLSDYNIHCEMTASLRSGISRYTFYDHEPSYILVDPFRALGNTNGGYVKINADNSVEGWNNCGNFCDKGTSQQVFFYAEFNSQPLKSGISQKGKEIANTSCEGDSILAYFEFEPNTEVMVKVGISYVSTANAKLNVKTEIPAWDFEHVAEDANTAWNNELSKVQVQTKNADDMTIFYTGLYHMLIHPNVFEDVNGEYVAMKTKEVKTLQDGEHRYTVFSLWDTYRDLLPFYTLIYPERQTDMLRSMVDMYKEGGSLPKWELASNETDVMVGDPAIPAIVDSYMKGFKDFDVEAAYEGMIKNATDTSDKSFRYSNKQYVRNHGFIPEDDQGDGFHWGSVSTSLEYNYADWCIAQMANKLNKTTDYNHYMEMAEGYKNYYDSTYKLLRPKNKDLSWLEPFHPDTTEGSKFWQYSGGPGYVEGNSWQYTWFVPHDIKGLIDLMGGGESFSKQLQKCFDTGNFIMANEPDMAYPYLFNYVPGSEWQAQEKVREYIHKSFQNAPDGLPGNDDCGVTSCWMVFSSLGFYPDCPGDNKYMLTSPLFDKISIKLNKNYYPAGELNIEVKNNAPENTYISNITFNNQRLKAPWLTHKQLTSGANVVMELGNSPVKDLFK